MRRGRRAAADVMRKVAAPLLALALALIPGPALACLRLRRCLVCPCQGCMSSAGCRLLGASAAGRQELQVPAPKAPR